MVFQFPRRIEDLYTMCGAIIAFASTEDSKLERLMGSVETDSGA